MNLRLIAGNQEKEPTSVSVILTKTENENINQKMDLTIQSKAQDGTSGRDYSNFTK